MSAAELFVWLVSGLHCEADTVKEEMQATKELWGRTGGRTYKQMF